MAWNYSGARVIVTGGAGFIGSHLCEALIHLGSEVVSVDNHPTGRAVNLDALAGHPSFSSLTQDITSPFCLRWGRNFQPRLPGFAGLVSARPYPDDEGKHPGLAKRARPRTAQQPPDDPRQPDITLAKTTLPWAPLVRLDEGLRETVAYFRKIVDS
jgi:nucleoside-diphosphate-sugar epimerase